MANARVLSPRKARSIEQLCEMRRDNFDADGHWIITDTFCVTMAQQAPGEGPQQTIKIPRKTFDKLIDWYIRDQKLTPQR